MLPEVVLRVGELPPGTPDRVLISIFVASYVATAHLKPRERAKALLQHAAHLMAERASVYAVKPIRAGQRWNQEAAAVAEADSLLAAMMPELIASLPEMDGI